MRFFISLAALVGLSLASVAHAQDWRALEVSGAVQVQTPGAAARPLNVNDVLPQGSVVTTGRDGQAVLSDGAARATVSANSRLSLSPTPVGFTRFVQELGAALFQVDRRAQPHFEVRTTLVAAVVKGTTFTVSVQPDAHSVFVAEGLVEVSPAAGGEGEMIGAGGLAEIDRNEPARVRTPQPEARSGQGRAQAAPLNYAALSNGLVRGREAEQAALVDDATQEGEALMLAFAEETASSAAPDEFPVPGGQDDGEDEPNWAWGRGGIDEELRGQGRGRGRGGLGGADDDNDQGEDEG